MHFKLEFIEFVVVLGLRMGDEWETRGEEGI